MADAPFLPLSDSTSLNSFVVAALTCDWYFVADDEAPRLVGTFGAAPTTLDLLPYAHDAGSTRPQVQGQQRDILMNLLDAAPALSGPSKELSEQLEPFKIGDIPEVMYIPRWIDSSQEADFIRHADVELNGWENMRTRSSQMGRGRSMRLRKGSEEGRATSKAATTRRRVAPYRRL